VLVDHRLCDGQSLAGPLAHIFCGEERLEGSILDPFRDATAGVGNLDRLILGFDPSGKGDCSLVASLGSDLFYRLGGVAVLVWTVCSIECRILMSRAWKCPMAYPV
jgi:hypothetical protein